MKRRPFLSQRLARWSLLVAAALHFGVAALGQYWHLAPRAPVPIAALDTSGEPRSDVPSPSHSDLACVVCHSVLGAVVLPAESVLPFATVVPVRRAPAHMRAVAGVRWAGPHARDPPVAA